MSATDFPNMCGGFPGLTSVGFPGFPKYLWRISRTYLRRISRISQVLWRISRTYHRRISRISQVPVADFPDLPPSDFPVFPDFPDFPNLTTVVHVTFDNSGGRLRRPQKFTSKPKKSSQTGRQADEEKKLYGEIYHQGVTATRRKRSLDLGISLSPSFTSPETVCDVRQRSVCVEIHL